jgi:hypothetical protein
MALNIAVIAEAKADFRVVSGLFDRVILSSDKTPAYIKDDPEQIKTERRFSGIQGGEEYTKRCHVKTEHKAFGRGPGLGSRFGTGLEDDLRDTERCVQLAILKGHNIDVLIISRDSDGKEERITSWQQVKIKYINTPFKIILAGQHCKLEAWILNGFLPKNESEKALLSELRSDLGFSPVSQAERLTAASAGAKKNPKKVLHSLTNSDMNREESCWSETPLDTLHNNGKKTGLSQYLLDIEDECVLLFQA